jgi:tetratricopeptide (TPR) repeat protein
MIMRKTLQIALGLDPESAALLKSRAAIANAAYGQPGKVGLLARWPLIHYPKAWTGYQVVQQHLTLSLGKAPDESEVTLAVWLEKPLPIWVRTGDVRQLSIYKRRQSFSAVFEIESEVVPQAAPSQVLYRLGLILRVAIVGVVILLIPAPRLAAIPQWVAQGDAAYRAGALDQAVTAYQAALDAEPGDAALFERLYVCALEQNRLDIASARLRQLAALRGWTTDRYRKMAALVEQQGDTQSAAAYWQASLNGSSADIPALHHLADFALQSRDWNAVRQALEQAAALNPQDTEALYQLGLLLAPTEARTAYDYLQRAAQKPEYQAANRAIDSVYAAYGNEAPASLAFRVGLALINLSAWPYAEHALSISLAQGQVSPVALAFLGLTQDQQGRDGWPDLNRAVESAPNDALVNYAVGMHWRLKGDSEKALAALSLARTLDPQNAAVAAEIGMVYRSGGYMQEALNWLNRAVALAPDDVGLNTLLANFYADENYNLANQGLTAIRQISQQFPESADITASLGWALLSTGDNNGARLSLQKALQLDSTNVRARYYFGVFLEYQGDTTGAMDSYLVVYRQSHDSGFRDRAARALERLGYHDTARSVSP